MALETMIRARADMRVYAQGGMCYTLGASGLRNVSLGQKALKTLNAMFEIT
jgi:hypothetical protein